MSTRLDRLFVLLDTGSTPLIRRSAAEQLGEVVHLHPHELNNLLSKVHNLLRSANWETRIAACHAVDAIAKNVPQWEPHGVIKSAGESAGMNGMILLSQFDIRKVLTCGASLLGSEGNQYDVGQSTVGMDDKEQLLQQRQLLNKRLGLDAAGALGFDSSSLFDDNDLRYTQFPVSLSNNNNSKLLVDFVTQELPLTAPHMSSREKNVAKRKARSLSKNLTNNGVSSEDSCPVKRIKRERSEGSLDSLDSTHTMEDSDEWPFQNFCEVLMNDLFHTGWETRHGAASGLREVIKHHGRGAGKGVDAPCFMMREINQLWLSDLAIRLLCVLTLDRFGDFVSDEVVAPVRETCAQALGATMKYMDEEAVDAVVNVSLQLLEQKEWEIRHSALLGLKYSLAVRQDMTPKLLPKVLPAIMQGLCDPDDDVRAVAASALLPVTDALVEYMPLQVPLILISLWNVLSDLDDLTCSTNSIMTLLAKLTAHTITKSSSFMTVPLTQLTPRLWPFLRHNITSVRKAALETFLTLLKLHDVQVTYQWILPIYQDAIRHIYQRSFLEEKSELLPLIVKVWQQLLECCQPDHLVVMTVPWLPVWLTFLMQPVRVPYDASLLIETKHKPRNIQISTAKGKLQSEARAHIVESKHYIAGCDSSSDNQVETDAAVNQARLTGANLLGMLAYRLCQPLTAAVPDMEDVSTSVGKLLSFHLNNKSALQRYVVGHVIYFWSLQDKPCSCPESVQSQLLNCLGEVIYYDEIAYAFTRLQSDCKDFLSSLKQQHINLDSSFPPGQLLTLEMATHLTTQVYKQVRSSLKNSVLNIFDERQKQLLASISNTSQEQQSYSIRVLCSLAMAVVGLGVLPEKLNPVVRPLMDVIKKEENIILQEEAAECLVKLIQACLSRSPNPNAKVVKNLCNFLCSDPTMTPSVTNPSSPITQQSQGNDHILPCSQSKGILTLVNLQRVTEQSIRRRARKANSASKGEIDAGGVDISQGTDQAENQENQRQASIQRQGAETALCALAKSLQENLSTILPSLWTTCLSFCLDKDTKESTPSGQSSTTSNETEESEVELHFQELVNSLQVLETLIPALHVNLIDQILEHLNQLLKLVRSEWTAVRHMSSRVFAALSLVSCSKIMPFVVKSVLPMLGAGENERMREGGMETVANIVDKLGMATLPYLVLLVIPVLGRMSDQSVSVRMMATQCFATLIRLMPLEAGTPNPPSAELWLTEKKESERHFLEQLLDTSKIDDYPITIPVNAELRKYQQDGVNWLGFLNKYKLHGILCDDMGLGKTLQSICILATDHQQRETKFKISQDADCSPLPSIVICPPTLVGHWIYEIEKFIQPSYLNPLMYMGPPGERLRLQKRVPHHNVIVASYEVVRNDIDFFSTVRWNYCILDEGHIIRNGKTKLAKATKQLISNHRLILSGTPIQNNVLDLWSLFDFLMPGFLGTERQFQARYGKPILQSRDAKSSSKEQEAGSLAMESLHRQVLPFILRRLKDDVLKDLPPKIIQDYYCDLSPLQIQLYEDFARSRAKQNVDDSVGIEEDSKEKGASTHQHIFQALQYLRKVCNHPALVVNSSHPKCSEIVASLAQHNSELRDITHAPKLTALKQLLNDCGIGMTAPPGTGNNQSVESTPVVNQHRVLLFCQLKSMLDIVEKDLLKAHMPSVSYLRLDGTVPPPSRQDIVHRFNSDPSIDILLLTTHVGGLGLNLTGADTVVFVEHDWNPMKDLQAMDRAHRIGQKKVVNVYRLITRGTLEEKIMGLQKFKMAVANTVISQDNSSLHSMGTDELLDLFVLDPGKEATGKEDNKKKDRKAVKTGQKESVHAILEGLGELWDESQYENEYNVEAFMKSLENAK